eukprot:scaffold540155_cov50-Prasinocladus_malaysianus.AAC.2
MGCPEAMITMRQVYLDDPTRVIGLSEIENDWVTQPPTSAFNLQAVALMRIPPTVLVDALWTSPMDIPCSAGW